MRFLLINPTRKIERNNIWRIIKSSTPPLGLAILAAQLEQHGFQVDIIDAQALQYSPEEIIANACIADDFYDIIGFTATTPEIESATKTSLLFRSAFPNARILFGGVHPTIFHRELVETGIADLVIRGEGEEPIVVLARSSDLSEVPGLTWKNKAGKVVVNALPEKLTDLDSLPLPAYHKLPMKLYRSALGAARKSPSIGMITSRGCPGTCTFCYSGMFGKIIRYASANRVLEHVTFLKKTYGIEEVSFYDDTFTTDRKRIIELCNLFIKEQLNLSWSCFARIDTVDKQLLDIMRNAGCHQIMYGFESSDDSVLKTINKRVTSKSYLDVVQMTRASGIDIRGAFMIGSPGETEQSVIQTIQFASNLGIQFAIFNITTPYPGTTLYNWAENKNCLIHHNWEDYDYAHPVMKLETLSPESVQKLYRHAYRAFYLRPSYLIGRIPGLISSGLLKECIIVLWGIIVMLSQKHGGRKR
jgi:radical SAM superfamily enzyme YgiQ (UPF0313 family)